MRFFFWLGHGPSPASPRKLSAARKILRMLPNIIFLLFDMLLVTFTIVLRDFYEDPQNRKNLISSSYIFTELATNVIIYLQFVFNKDVLNRVVREFDEVAQVISLNFGGQPEWDKMLKQIRMKMFWISSAYILDICLYFLRSLLPSMFLSKKWPSVLLYDAMRSVTVIGCMHIVLYINLLNFYLKTLNRTLIRCSTTCEIYHTMDTDQFVFLHRIKLIHFRLWNIAQDINRFFGCGLGAILLRNFADATFGIYWAFLILNNQNSWLLLIRTYNHFMFEIE